MLKKIFNLYILYSKTLEEDDEDDAASDAIHTSSNLVVEKSEARKKTSVAVYHDVDGNPLGELYYVSFVRKRALVKYQSQLLM